MAFEKDYLALGKQLYRKMEHLKSLEIPPNWSSCTITLPSAEQTFHIARYLNSRGFVVEVINNKTIMIQPVKYALDRFNYTNFNFHKFCQDLESQGADLNFSLK